MTQFTVAVRCDNTRLFAGTMNKRRFNHYTQLLREKIFGNLFVSRKSRISVTTQIEVMFGRKGMSVKVIWCQFFKIYFIVCFHNDSHILQSNCNEILRRWDIFIDQSICISIVDLIVHENFMMFIANPLCEVFCTVIQGNIKKCE